MKITKNSVYREITPLNSSDCFTIFKRNKKEFSFPLHSHEEFELNFILNAEGAKRIVGDNVEVIGNLELVLLGSNLPHGWFTHTCSNTSIHEITIQFHRDLFDEKFLRRNQMSHVRALLDRSSKGVLFSPETTKEFQYRIEHLNTKRGFNSVLELMSILHDLALTGNLKTLSNTSFTQDQFSYSSRRIHKAYEYMEANYDKEISLSDIAKVINMPEVSSSRFIKKRTGKTFIESLNEIRLGHASRLLIDTTQTIAEISFKCGFNNLSYFNRIFKRKNGCTPTEFRQNYSGVRVFV